MYPTLVAVLVNSHRTFDQVYLTNISLPQISISASNNHGNITAPMVFAFPDNDPSTGTLPKQVETRE
jgi:hypothetical protein